ncbi:MAG: helix-turn-helix domain-containing protein [Micromonosporaceae bacterium]
MVLLRRVLGDALRTRRLDQDRTLRDVSTSANVSLGYLSEIERGQKEASSELLSSICDALDTRLSEVLREASGTLALAEEMAGMLQPVPAQQSGESAAKTPETVDVPDAVDAEDRSEVITNSLELTIERPRRTDDRSRDVVFAA